MKIVSKYLRIHLYNNMKKEAEVLRNALPLNRLFPTVME